MDNVQDKNRKKERQQFLFPELNCIPFTQKKASEIVNTTIEILINTLIKGETVVISGFGKFQVKFKWARKGRNPQTGKEMILKSRKVVTFQTSPKLKEKINQHMIDA